MVEGFVGREAQVRRLEAALDQARAGRGSLILLSGEPGIGKSRLAAQVTACAADTGATILWASCWEDPATPGYHPWVQCLRGLADQFDDDELSSIVGPETTVVVRLVPALCRRPAPSATEPPVSAPDPRSARFQLFDAVSQVLRRAAMVRPPLVVVLDDLHWADTPSLLLLRAATREVRNSPVLLIGTYRDVDLRPGDDSARLLLELVGDGQLLRLEGLDAPDVAALMASVTGTLPAPEVAEAVRRRSGGNPLFVLELAHLALEGKHDWGEAIPGGARAVLERRLAHVDASTRTLLAAAAVAGTTFRAPLVARVAALEVDQVVTCLEEAARAGLVSPPDDPSGPWSFTHALVRDVLYDDLSLPRRSRSHRAFAEALEAGDDVEDHLAEIAAHFRRAGWPVDAMRAADYAERAGLRALAMLAYEEAAAHFERGLEALAVVGGREERRVELLLALGDAQLRAGQFGAARRAFQDAADLARHRGRGDELARAALGLGSGLAGFEVRLFDEDQLELLEEALEILGPADTPLRAWVLARLSVALSFLASPQRRRELAQEAVDVARRAADPAALAYALGAHCDAIAGPSHTEERRAAAGEIVQLARQAGDRPTELLGRRLRLVALLELGDIRGADAEIAAFARTAERLRQPLYLWYVPLWRGMRALMEGRLTDCERLASQAEEIGRRAHSENATVLVANLRQAVSLEARRADQALAALQTLIEDEAPIGDPPLVQAWIAHFLVEGGREVEARGLLDRLGASAFSELPEHDGQWLAAMCALAETCSTLDVAEYAEILHRLLAPHSRRFAVDGIADVCLGPVARHLGLLASVLERWEEAAGRFDEALAATRRTGSTLFVAHTLRDYGRMLARKGAPDDVNRGAALLDEAGRIYRDLGIHLRAASVDELVSSLSAGSPSAAGPPAENTFRREGELWTLAYHGAVVHLRDTKGLATLARLLARPGSEIHVLDLMADGGRGRPAAHEDGLAEAGDTGEVLDAQARAAYKARLAELEAEIEEATSSNDPERAGAARAEHDALVAALAAAYGLHGRPRRTGDPTERARSAVSWRIRNALARIDEAHPVLGRHFRNSIRTGVFCSYQPEQPTSWRL